jgi:phosphatidylglycerophosphate synthase
VRVWIDATSREPEVEIFGMTLLERLLRSLLEAQKQRVALRELEKELRGLAEARAYIRDFLERHLEPSEVRIELAPGAALPESIPASMLRKLPIIVSQGDASPAARLAQATRDADGEPLLAMSSDTVVDVRVIEHLVWAAGPMAFFAGTGDGRGAIVRIDEPLEDAQLECAGPEQDLVALAQECVDLGVTKELNPEEFDGYVRKLRRTLEPYLFRVTGEPDAARLEHFLFWSNYKGATDFLTKYVYPPLVWRAVKPLAARRIPPNAVTAVGIACCFAAVPFFATGWWIPALLLAYTMSVLDSVDGKLARVTYSSSRQGDVLDHGTDVVHPPIWYIAWAWGLSGGDASSTVFVASLVMGGLYALDRILESLFKSCTGGRSVQDYTPLDTRLRTFVSRRNVNLAIFTVALPLGLGAEGFFAIVGLQLATVVYHAVRVAQCWNDGEEAAQRA